MRQMVKGTHFSEWFAGLLTKKRKEGEWNLMRGVVVEGPFSDFYVSFPK